jgi:GT2 family glycosyltransferase
MMLKSWAKYRVKQLYHRWAGADPLSRPQGLVFNTLSSAWRGSRKLYRRWKQQPAIVLAVDGVPRLTGFGSFTGWVIGRDAPISNIEAWCGDILLGTTRPDAKRSDVELAFPHYRRPELLGFRVCPLPGKLVDGEHQVRIVAIDDLGQTAEIASPLIVDRFTQQDSNELPVHLTGSNREYQHWLKAHDRHQLREVKSGARLSVVIPLYRPRHEHFIEAVESVRAQTYQSWELLLSDDGNNSHELTQLCQQFCQQDSRIRFAQSDKNQGISQATNRGIQTSTGEYVAFMDQDDRLHPQALQAIAVQIEQQPADFYYTDEDRLDAAGERVEPFFKPDWSPELLKSLMYAGHLCVYRRSMLNQVGYCDSEYDGTQDWELALRVTDQPGCRSVHIPGIFYHWRIGGHSSDAENNQRCHQCGEQAVAASFDRLGRSEKIEQGFRPCTFTMRPKCPYQKVSILIPTRDNHLLLKRCLESIRQRTTYPDYEIILIDNGSTEPETVRYLKNCPVDQGLCIDEPFNHSALNNWAAMQAKGEYLLLLNDDTEALSKDWLERMVEQASREEVGAVGALLHYPDGRIQHAGVMLEREAVARHYSSASMLDGIDRGLHLLTRPVSAVTGACLMIRRQLYLDCGGLDETNLPTSYNDVDLCLRLKQSGYCSVMAPQARLIHHESATRKISEGDELFRQYMRRKYAVELEHDTFWNVHLGQEPDVSRGLAFHWK